MRDPKQWEGEAPRVVYTDSGFDLFVWLDGKGNTKRFQLGYGKPGRIRVFEWLNGELYHYRVDTGDDETVQVNRMGLLVPDMSGDPTAVANKLESMGVDEEAWILEGVLAVLRRG